MRVIIMDLTGHTELLTPEHVGTRSDHATVVADLDALVAETESRMRPGDRILIERSDRTTEYLDGPMVLRDAPADATAYVLRPIAGG